MVNIHNCHQFAPSLFYKITTTNSFRVLLLIISFSFIKLCFIWCFAKGRSPSSWIIVKENYAWFSRRNSFINFSTCQWIWCPQLFYAVFRKLIKGMTLKVNVKRKWCFADNSFVWKADILILLLLALLSCREVTFQHLDYFAISQRTYVFIKSSTYVKLQMLRDLRVCGLRVGRLT